MQEFLFGRLERIFLLIQNTENKIVLLIAHFPLPIGQQDGSLDANKRPFLAFALLTIKTVQGGEFVWIQCSSRLKFQEKLPKNAEASHETF